MSDKTNLIDRLFSLKQGRWDGDDNDMATIADAIAEISRLRVRLAELDCSYCDGSGRKLMHESQLSEVWADCQCKHGLRKKIATVESQLQALREQHELKMLALHGAFEQLAAKDAELRNTSRDYSELRDSFDKHRENEFRLEAEIQTPENQRILEIRRLESELQETRHAENMLRHEMGETQRVHNAEMNRMSEQLAAKNAGLQAAQTRMHELEVGWNQTCVERSRLAEQLAAKDVELKAALTQANTLALKYDAAQKAADTNFDEWRKQKQENARLADKLKVAKEALRGFLIPDCSIPDCNNPDCNNPGCVCSRKAKAALAKLEEKP